MCASLQRGIARVSQQRTDQNGGRLQAANVLKGNSPTNLSPITTDYTITSVITAITEESAGMPQDHL